MKNTAKQIYELRNLEGCHFGSCTAKSLRSARAYFSNSFSGRFIVEGTDGSYMYVNL